MRVKDVSYLTVVNTKASPVPFSLSGIYSHSTGTMAMPKPVAKPNREDKTTKMYSVKTDISSVVVGQLEGSSTLQIVFICLLVTLVLIVGCTVVVYKVF